MARRKSRSLALGVLFQIDVGKIPPEEAIRQSLEAGRDPDGYALRLVEGVLAHLSEIDGFIAERSRGWKVHRMPGVDRNILRMALYELEWEKGVPTPVVIDEAVELAKIYAAEDAPKFVNGLLSEHVKGWGGSGAGDDT